MNGPFYESKDELDEYVRRTWYTQKPPFTAPLPYTVGRVLVTKRDRAYKIISAGNSGGTRLWNWDSREAYSQAYSKFQSKLGESAAWGENLAQYKQTFETAVDLLELCVRPTRKIAKILNGFSKRAFKGRAEFRGNPKNRQQFQRFVGRGDLGSGDRWMRPLKEVNAAYLQYVYGLKPLLSDLQATLLVLDKPADFSWDIETFGTEFVNWRDKGSWYERRADFKCCVKLAANVTCTNPNLHKAQSLGLTNPVALSYELIPFSFIFDYICDVGGFLSSFDDMLGLKMTDAYVTRYNKGSGFDHYSGGDYSYLNTDWTALWMQRTPSQAFPAPRPYFKLKLSHWKAIHACSVLASVGLLRGR